MAKHNEKQIFSAICTITPYTTPEGHTRHTPRPSSPAYVHDRLKRIQAGKKVRMTISEDIPTFSEQQRDYHFVLCVYLAEHTGFTKNEMHDVIMKLKYGVRYKEFRGKKFEVRESISDVAQMPKHMVTELIQFDLQLCAEENVKVPSRKDLGYDEVEEKIDNKEFHKDLDIPSGPVNFE